MKPVCELDAERLAEMHARCFPEEPWDTRAMAEILAIPGAFGFRTTTGFALAYAAAGSCDITTIGVLPRARRRGVARKLLEALLAEAKRRGAESVLLEVAEDNRAGRRLYETVGFRPERKRRNYYADGRAALTLRLGL